MILIAVWFTLTVLNATTVVMNQVQDKDGLGPLVDVGFLVLAVYFLADQIKQEIQKS